MRTWICVQLCAGTASSLVEASNKTSSGMIGTEVTAPAELVALFRGRGSRLVVSAVPKISFRGR